MGRPGSGAGSWLAGGECHRLEGLRARPGERRKSR